MNRIPFLTPEISGIVTFIAILTIVKLLAAPWLSWWIVFIPLWAPVVVVVLAYLILRYL